MIDFQPVEYDPFVHPPLQPIEHDPFADNLDPAAGPVGRGQPSVLDYAKQFVPGVGGGVYGAMKVAGAQTPEWMDAAARVAQNPDLNTAIGMAAPITPAGFAENLSRLVAKGVSQQQIAQELGVGKGTVFRNIQKLGLQANPTSTEAGAWADQQNVSLLKSMLEQGSSTREIAAAIGSSSGRVTEKMRQMGLRPNNPPGFLNSKQGYQPSLPKTSLPDVGPGDPWLMKQLGYGLEPIDHNPFGGQ